MPILKPDVGCHEMRYRRNGEVKHWPFGKQIEDLPPTDHDVAIRVDMLRRSGVEGEDILGVFLIEPKEE